MAKKYDYRQAVTEDVKEYIQNNIDLEWFDDREELEECLNDRLWDCDEVTGNASGSYTFNKAEAKGYVMENIELLADVMDSFGELMIMGEKIYNGEWEYLDVLIRCWYLSAGISYALDDYYC